MQTAAPLPAASVVAFAEKFIPIFHAAVDTQQIIANVNALVNTERFNSFDHFHRTTRTLVDAYQLAGAQTEIYTAPTGGSQGSGKWIVPEATDLRSGTVDIIAPIEKRLIDYQANPWQLIMWGNGTDEKGLVGDLTVIDTEERLSRLPANWLRGKIVLSRLDPRAYRARFYEKGAAAIIFDPLVTDRPDATAWVRFGWGGNPLRDAVARPVGFVLSANEGDALRALAVQHGKLTLRVKADIRRYVGSHDVISGIVPGRDDPQSEIWALAHSCEPGALDNSSGVAVCIEIARMLNTLIAAGKIPPPRRSIRLVNGFECYGFFHYFENHPRFQSPLAGVDIDIVGAHPDVCKNNLRWYATVPSSAGFVNEVGDRFIQAAMQLDDAGYVYTRRPFLSTEDTLIGDPKYGFPCPWITNHPIAGYHSSADTPDHLWPRGLALTVTSMAAYLYYLADAGTPEAIELAEWDTQTTIGRMQALTGNTDEIASQRRFIKAQHDASIERAMRFVWNGNRANLLSRFAEFSQAVDDVPTPVHADGQVSQSASPPPAAPEVIDEESQRLLKCIPVRRAPLAITVENIFPPLDEAMSAIRKWGHYWADGNRTVSQVLELARIEWKQPVTVAKFLGFIRGMQTLGFLDLLDPDIAITQDRLVADLKSLGLQAGMDVMVHSSLSKLGPVIGGGATVVAALLEVLGPGGTLLAPAFTQSRGVTFNLLTTPAKNGAISEAVRTHPHAQRSLHPTHSVCAIGERAAYYVADHLTHGIWAPNSPIGRLIHGGGYVLALGTTHHTTTAYHVAEISVQCRCLDQFGNLQRVVTADGSVQEVRGLAWRERACPVDDRLLDPALDEIGVQQHGKVGLADSTLVKAHEVFAMRRHHLRQGAVCQSCPVRPKYDP